jgi:hypothetical protein
MAAMTNKHTRYVILTPTGYIGSKYISHATFEAARIYTRKRDAQREVDFENDMDRGPVILQEVEITKKKII